MNCDRARILLDGYIDGELDLVNAIDVEDHLNTCPDCSQKYAEWMELRAAFTNQKAALFQPAPAGLADRVRTSVRKANHPQSVWTTLAGSQPWRPVALAATFVALLAVVIGLASGWFVPSQNTVVAQEVETAHIRSLMADHLTDVTSSNQHTVKPWFDGKLDFSPPVMDLAAQGFPLIGGRLDYLNGRQVAALVYHKDKHIINLFLWPSNQTVIGIQKRVYNGYNVYEWSQSGMSNWSISDLNDMEMRTFIQLVQKNFK